MIHRQSRSMSLFESAMNVGSGFVLSLMVQEVVYPLFHIATSHSQNIGIALIFTAVSLARSYCWRRFFARAA